MKEKELQQQKEKTRNKNGLIKNKKTNNAILAFFLVILATPFALQKVVNYDMKKNINTEIMSEANNILTILSDETLFLKEYESFNYTEEMFIKEQKEYNLFNAKFKEYFIEVNKKHDHVILEDILKNENLNRNILSYWISERFYSVVKNKDELYNFDDLKSTMEYLFKEYSNKNDSAYFIIVPKNDIFVANLINVNIADKLPNNGDIKTIYKNASFKKKMFEYYWSLVNKENKKDDLNKMLFSIPLSIKYMTIDKLIDDKNNPIKLKYESYDLQKWNEKTQEEKEMILRYSLSGVDRKII